MDMAFATAPDVAAEIGRWLAYLGAEKRMSPKTLDAYRRDVGWGPRRTPGSALDTNHLFTARVVPTLQGEPDGPAASR